MARDFRHGHHHNKQQFQRKSQSSSQSVTNGKSSVPMIWAGGFLVSAVLLIGFFVTQHFVSQSAKSEASAETSIFKVAKEIKEQAVEKVQEVSEKMQPKTVVVEAVNLQEDEGLTEVDQKPSYSFYEGLGQMEVVVDAVPLSVALKQPYYIQAGTFGSEKVAKQEQARLAKLGETLQISVLTTKKRTYYRLRVGPFVDRLVLNKKRNELRRLGVDTLLLKAPKVESN
ncbi:MAG: SPOR domain-containing protein [Pseudomonadota bacterium]|nr:SPOR domain-containing protein [Pseudomonadota bacterium]